VRDDRCSSRPPQPISGVFERPLPPAISARPAHGTEFRVFDTHSRRTLALGALSKRYRAWIASLTHHDPEAWVFPQDEDKRQPMWDSGVRSAQKAAAAEGCDFPGLGPHSLRRANITWRQEVGGSSIETSQSAGHANTKITEAYTIVQLHGPEQLTRRIQAKARRHGSERARSSKSGARIRLRERSPRLFNLGVVTRPCRRPHGSTIESQRSTDWRRYLTKNLRRGRDPRRQSADHDTSGPILLKIRISVGRHRRPTCWSFESRLPFYGVPARSRYPTVASSA